MGLYTRPAEIILARDSRHDKTIEERLQRKEPGGGYRLSRWMAQRRWDGIRIVLLDRDFGVHSFGNIGK